MENKCNLSLLLLNTQMVNFYFFNTNCVKCCYKLNFFVLLHFFREIKKEMLLPEVTP